MLHTRSLQTIHNVSSFDDLLVCDVDGLVESGIALGMTGYALASFVHCVRWRT